jgi:hypothetical protein
LWLILRLIADRFVVAENRLRVFNLLKQACLTTFFALLTFWMFSPRLWLNPIAGTYQYIYLNTHRTLNIAVLFFGDMYNLSHSLPWYNTLAWTAITVPIGLFVLFFIGLAVIIRDKKKRWSGLWIFLNLSALLFLRALPGTPVHDGVRMFVPAFLFLAMIAGIGAAAFWNRKKETEKKTGKFRLCSQLSVLLIYIVCLFNMFWYAPQWLSFYNAAIGGLPGAVRAGMEPTYYWDGFDDEVLHWLKENTKPDNQIAFSAHSSETLRLYFSKKDFQIPFEILSATTTIGDSQTESFRYYVLQRRPSGEFERDKQLMKQKKPVFVKTIRQSGWGIWNLSSVPIIEIYEISR